MPSSILNDPDFLTCVDDVQATFSVHGIALAVIDTTGSAAPSILTKGFGELSSGPVTGESVFCIASNTKLFVAVGLGILEEEGKLKWDSKVKDLVPDLHFLRQDAQETITIADMLSHQTGLSGHLSIEASTRLQLKDTVQRINHLRFTTAPREAYQYCNITYALAGVIIERLSGQSFPDFVRQRILQPLGMYQTTWTKPAAGLVPVIGSAGGDNVSVEFDSPMLGYSETLVTAASGGLLSTAHDMGIWVSWLLRRIEGKQAAEDPKIIGQGTLQDIITPRIMANQQIGAVETVPGKALWSELSPPQYGFAQLLFEYQGIKIASHNGTMNGGGSIMLWCPEKGFGLVILTNVMSVTFGAAAAIALKGLERHFGFPAVDWIARVKALTSNQDDQKEAVEDLARVSIPDDKWRLKDLVGEYYDPGYGKLHVAFASPPEGSESESGGSFMAEFRARLQRTKKLGPEDGGKPDLIAVLEDLPFYDTYQELWHLGGGVFRGQDRYLSPSYGANDSAIDMPLTTIWPASSFRGFVFRRNADGTLEVEKYRNAGGEKVPGRGTVTFIRQT